MDRLEFIKICGLTCLAGTSVAAVLQRCAPAQFLTGNIEGDDLIVPLKFFETGKNGEMQYKDYLVVHNELLQYPICVYRISASEFSALWMRCTHQGTEVQVFGDVLQCPSHGSEFDNSGGLRNGPADQPLRTFPVTIEKDHLKISLKAV